MIKKSLLFIIIDLFIVTLIFGILIWIKPGTLRVYLPTYREPFILFLGLWFIISLFSGKYQIFQQKKFTDLLRPIFIANFIVLSIISIAFFGLELYGYSRLIVFGTILFSTILELFVTYIYYNNLHRNRENEYHEPDPEQHDNRNLDPETGASATAIREDNNPLFLLPERYRDLIISETSREVYEFIAGHLSQGYNPPLVLSTTTSFNIENQFDDYYRSIVNLKKINDIKRVNKFFETVNKKLPVGGYFIDSVQTNEIKKEWILKRYPILVNYFVYFWYYVYRRLIPKLPVTKQLYFFITNGWDRALSKAETYGRLYCCGFELVDIQQIGGLLYFVARKIKEPCFDLNPTYGILIRLKRLGKGGKTITVYKFRTMHPYAEYIQDYVFKQYNLQEGGKFKNDFRVTTAGKIFRKFWLDELPMLITWIKGDVKLFGVRPLSRHYFELYSEEVKAKRIRFKPGLIPPFYADMPKTLEEIMASEMVYLEQYEKSPFSTDLKYLFNALYNIIVKRARSK
jgi:lipopolysaccharide/colanic/teichoic acid biosynthesis glycosyltransferase